MGGGAAFFDFDNDGDDDLWMTGGINRDVLYENDGVGSFTEIGMAAGLTATNGHVTSGVITADLDNDGFRDVLVNGHNGFHPLLFRNNGDGTFPEISGSAGLANFEAQSYAATFGDVNKDGWLDIYIANYIDKVNLIYDGNGDVVAFDHDCFRNYLFINNGDMTFTEAAADYGVKNTGCALATTFTEYDGDADPDLLIANDFGEWITPNTLYQNEYPNNSFSDVSMNTGMDVGIYGMGIAIGDYDQDLDLDYYVTNLGRNVLLENQGNQNFLDKATETGVEDTFMDSLLATGWGTAFIDVDNDADLDLFVSNGYVPSANFIGNSKANQNRLFLNNGNANGNGFTFSESAFDASLNDPGRGRGFAYSDVDNDGDLDFLVINVNKQTTPDTIQKVLLYRNDLESENNWLKVKLQGITSNRDAFGSTIKIVLGDQSWVHDYNGGFGSHASQHSSVAHFGLGGAEIVDSLSITWPGGTQSYLTNLSVNQTLVINENGTITNAVAPNNIAPIQLAAFPNPFSSEIHFRFEMLKPGYAELDIFDKLGRKMDSINRTWYSEGVHVLNWKRENTSYSSRLYFVRLKTDDQIRTIKLIRIN